MKDKNPVKKERLENLKKASALPFGKRMRYYFDFFKFHLLGAAVIALLVFLVLKEIVFAPEVILNGYVINRTEFASCTDEEFISSFPEYEKINPKKQKIYFGSDLFLNDNDIDSTTKLVVNASSGDIDYMICNRETFDRLCRMGLLSNLEDYPEIKAKYEDELIYYDHTKNDTSEDDSLGDKPYGINVSDSAVLKNFNVFHEDEDICLCLGINSNPTDILYKFIEWIKQ